MQVGIEIPKFQIVLLEVVVKVTIKTELLVNVVTSSYADTKIRHVGSIQGVNTNSKLCRCKCTYHGKSGH